MTDRQIGGASPRIYCIPATAAPIVAVLRRGPSEWWNVGRWQLDEPGYESGAWFRGRLYARRCDLSPDGRWLSYFALKGGSTWEAGDTYCAISRLPWLKALAAWPSCGTWTRGYHFVEERRNAWEIGEPQRGDVGPCRARYGMKAFRPVQFAAERHRGWRETPDCPPRFAGDSWDQRRNARMSKRQPEGELDLVVESVGRPGGEWGGDAVEGLRVSYWLEGRDDLCPLEEAQWADRDDRGRLLVATRRGALQIRRLRGFTAEVEFERDLAPLEPDPMSAPPWAEQW
jgi:hypothetical protein